MRRNWLLWLALVLAAGGFLATIGGSALWEPHEVAVAELARRIALNLLGGGELALPGADNSVPIRADLGRGELPFTSVALGFRAFGLSAWAGRLPLALWSLLGLGGLYAALRVVWSARVGLYACLVLATLPLCFLQARTLLGDAVTLATFTLAWSGLSAACWGRGLSAGGRAAFALLGAVGLYAGFWCRGPIVSVAVPALSVGLAAVAARPEAAFARRLALGATVVGLLALALGYQGLELAARTLDYSVFVGGSLSAASTPTSFDTPLGQLIHAAFPWSAALPLSLALVVSSPRGESSVPRPLVNAAALGVGFGLAAAAGLAPQIGPTLLPGVGCLAVLIGGALAEVDAGRLGSPLLGLVAAAAALVIGFDLRTFPEKTLVPFGIPGVVLPDAPRETWSPFWVASSLALGVIAVVALFERGEVSSPFDRREYAAVLSRFQTLWDGNLVFALLVLEAALVGILLLSAVSERLVPLPQLDAVGSFTRKIVAFGAMGVPFLPVLPLGAMLLRDLGRVAFSGSARSLGRGQGILLAFAAVGGLASAGFYPAVARQLSPQEAIQRYRELSRSGEPLAFIGERSEGPRYQGVTGFESFSDSQQAFAWLMQGSGQRRWLIARSGDLAEINLRFRGARRRNVPVLDARSSALLLLSNHPGPSDESPLRDLVLDAPPAPQSVVSAVLGDKLEVLGWSVHSPRGAPLTSVSPGRPFRFTIYFRVRASLPGVWQTFVHFDGLQRRFNADHEPLEGHYPTRYWRQNDIIADATEVLLEPNFSPGDYQVYFGLFQGEQRLPVTAGPHAEDRIVGGAIRVH